MSWLVKHPRSIRSPSGWEWRVWKKLPVVLAVGTLLPLAMGLVAWWSSAGGPDGALSPEVLRFEFVLAGIVILHWTLVLTLAICCGIVMLMKGPTYMADSYPLPDSDRPLP